MQTLQFKGQEIYYRPEEHTITTRIREPFWTAFKLLGWNIKSPGFGINDSIMDFIRETQMDLIVLYLDKKYKVMIKDLEDFLDNNKTSYVLKNKITVKVIPMKIFNRIDQ